MCCCHRHFHTYALMKMIQAFRVMHAMHNQGWCLIKKPKKKTYKVWCLILFVPVPHSPLAASQPHKATSKEKVLWETHFLFHAIWHGKVKTILCQPFLLGVDFPTRIIALKGIIHLCICKTPSVVPLSIVDPPNIIRYWWCDIIIILFVKSTWQKSFKSTLSSWVHQHLGPSFHLLETFSAISSISLS